jgi:hypothetical protein
VKGQARFGLKSQPLSVLTAKAQASIIIPGLPAPYVTAKVWLQLLKAQQNDAMNVKV